MGEPSAGKRKKKTPNEFTRRNVLFGKMRKRKKGDVAGSEIKIPDTFFDLTVKGDEY